MAQEQTHFQTCNLCEAMCGIEIKHSNGQIISIKGDKLDPLSRGHICPKATALQDLHYDPDRLRRPLERSQDGWREISWSEALDKAAAGIQQVQSRYGRDAFASYLGNPNVHNTGCMLFVPALLKAIGSRNKFSATSVDQLPHQLLAYHLFGHQLQLPVPDIDRCNYFLILGANPIASNGSIMSVPDVKKRLQAIQARGGKLVVIDPRKTETATLADQHLFIQPGSDALLLLAMIHTLYADGLLQTNRTTAFTDGLDQISHWVKEFTPQLASKHTGISAETIVALTHEFAKAKNAVCYGRMGVSVQRFGLLSQYLIMVLNILTGRLDEPGGMMFSKPAANLLGQISPGHFGKFTSRVRQLPEFAGELPVATMAEEILSPGEGQIRGLITVAGNPVLSTPNGRHLDQALDDLDFMVSVDFYINETSRHAHIILPPVSPLERDHYDLVFHSLAIRNTAKFSPALFKKARDAKHDWQIFLELQQRLRPPRNLKEKLQRAFIMRAGPNALLRLLFAIGPYGGWSPFSKVSLGKLKSRPHGIDLGALQPCLPEAIFHNSKRIDLHCDFYEKDLQRLKHHFFNKTAETDFLLIGRRHVRSNNSWLHNSHRLVKGKSRCTAIIHPEDAQRLALADGDLLTVRSNSGELQIIAEVSDTIKPGVVSIPHGFGHDRPGIMQTVAQQHAGVSINDLTDHLLLDELSGNAVLNGVPVSLITARDRANSAASDPINNTTDTINDSAHV